MDYRPDRGPGSDTQDLIAMRQQYAATTDPRARAQIARDYEARHGITDVNDTRHAAWYAQGRFEPRSLSPAEQAEADLAFALDHIEAFDRFDAEHGGAL